MPTNVNFVGTLIFLRIPERANKIVVPDSAKLSGFRKCRGILQIYADSAYNLQILLHIAEFAYILRISLTICRFHFQLRIPRQLVFTKHIHYCLLMDSTNCFWIPHILLRAPQNCLFLQRFCETQCFSYLSVESETTEQIKKIAMLRILR